MIVLALAGIAGGGALVALLLRRWRRIAGLVALIAFASVAAVAVLPLGAPLDAPFVPVGTVRIVDTALVRMWLLVAALSLATLEVVALCAGARSTAVPALAGLVATALALSLEHPVVALTVAAIVAFIAVASGSGVRDDTPAEHIAGAEGAPAHGERVVAAEGDLEVVAPDPVWTLPAFRVAAVLPALPAFAALAVPFGGRWDEEVGLPVGAIAGLGLLTLAVGLRIGLIPFHRAPLWLAGGSRLSAVPFQSAWAPAVFVAVAIAWAQTSVLFPAFSSSEARFAIAVAAVLTITVAAVAMLLQSDLGRLVAVGAVQDGAVAVLALSAAPDAREAATAWLIAAAAGRTALGAVVVGIGTLTGTRAVPLTRGWARRAPILAVALVVGGIALYGWPGILTFDLRVAIVDRALAGPLATVALVASLASAVAYGRLLVLGLLPAPPPDEPVAMSGSDARASEWPPIRVPDAPRPWRWRPNGMWFASIAAVALAGIAVALASGLTALQEAAASRPPFAP